jgi:hypothetical protein
MQIQIKIGKFWEAGKIILNPESNWAIDQGFKRTFLLPKTSSISPQKS